MMGFAFFIAEKHLKCYYWLYLLKYCEIRNFNKYYLEPKKELKL